MNQFHAVLLVAVVSFVTILLRFLPFLIFGFGKKTPEFSKYIEKVLPHAIMGMLVIYCLRNIPTGNFQTGTVQLLACAVVALLHLWKRNTLLSIIGGTMVYMFLVQVCC